jgi:hypothetical protein
MAARAFAFLRALYRQYKHCDGATHIAQVSRLYQRIDTLACSCGVVFWERQW